MATPRLGTHRPVKLVLVLGPPRSGSTWVSQVIASVPGAVRSHEPDNDAHVPFALVAKAGRGRHPWVRAGDDPADYAALWRTALTPGARARRAVASTLAGAVL